MVNDTETTSIASTEAVPTESVLAADELTQSTLSWAKMPFVNKPIENPQRCIVLSLGKGPACLDPKSFGPNFNPSPIAT
ncbi:hypothetical protein K7432_014485 [Basidiobolus ranarum]|uniref:Uncharacterized protein n=1 Tax=Basidiobolus ranarum TaxID=34480 RepID=A0ABR2WHK0_9FUNG